jgi:hypothetical protein
MPGNYHSIQSSTDEYPKPVDVYITLLTSLQEQVSSGGITFRDPKKVDRHWIRVEDIREENRIYVKFCSPGSLSGQSAFSNVVSFASCLRFIEFNPSNSTEIWQAAGPLSTFSIEKLAETFDQIFLKVYGLAASYVVQGVINSNLPGRNIRSKKVPWEYDSMLLEESKIFTEEELRTRILRNPKDAEACLMLAERTGDMEERINLVRSNIHHSDERLDLEGRKAWNRLYNEIPTHYYQAHDSIYAFPGVEKLDMSTEGLSETIFTICDCTQADGKHQESFAVRHNPLKMSELFDRIIKLSWAHYLCRSGSKFTLWYSCDDYFLIPGPSVPIEGEPTLDKFIQSIPQLTPKIQSSLASYIHKDPELNEYVSEYRKYIWGFDDFTFHFASGMVILHDDFNVTPWQI